MTPFLYAALGPNKFIGEIPRYIYQSNVSGANHNLRPKPTGGGNMWEENIEITLTAIAVGVLVIIWICREVKDRWRKSKGFGD